MKTYLGLLILASFFIITLPSISLAQVIKPCPQQVSELSDYCSNLKSYICPEERIKIPPMPISDYQLCIQKMRTKEFSDRLQSHIQSAISEEAGLSNDSKKILSDIAKEAKPVFEMEDAMEMGLTDEALLYIKSVRILQCGLEGNMTNAIAIYVGNQKIISVCPGTVARMVHAGMSAQEMADRMTFLMAHETGHFLFKQNEDLYDKFKQCLLKHPTHENLTKEKTYNIFKILFADLRVGPHLNEIAADHWGNRAVAQMLKTNRSTNVFRGNYNFMCGIANEDDGEHPGLDYRFNFLTRHDPGIASTLGCPNTNNCSLKK